MSRNLLTRMGLILAPALAAAGVIGGAVAFAQVGDDGSPTPTPQEQATPDATPKSRDGSDCPQKRGSDSEEQPATTNSGV